MNKKALLYSSLLLMGIVSIKPSVVSAEELVTNDKNVTVEDINSSSAPKAEALLAEKERLITSIERLENDINTNPTNVLSDEILALEDKKNELDNSREELTRSEKETSEKKERVNEEIDALIREKDLISKPDDSSSPDKAAEVLLSEKNRLEEEKRLGSLTYDSLNKELTHTKKEMDDTRKALTTLSEENATLTYLEASKSDELTRLNKDFNSKIKQLENDLETARSMTSQPTLEDIHLVTSDSNAPVEKYNPHHMESVKYSGKDTVYVNLTADQLAEYEEKGYFSYVPNNEKINRYAIDYLNELRRLNGLPATITFSQASFDMALKRAKEQYDNYRMHKKLIISHNSRYDGRTSENIMGAEVLNRTKDLKNNSYSEEVLSDQQMAYYLILQWFADYTNVKPGDYGHREGLFGNFAHFGTAVYMGDNHQNNPDYRVMYASMNTVDNSLSPRPTFGPSADGSSWLMNGKEMMFLPRTEFVYCIKKASGHLENTEAKINKIEAELAKTKKAYSEQLSEVEKELATWRQKLADNASESQQMTKTQQEKEQYRASLQTQMDQWQMRQQAIVKRLMTIDDELNMKRTSSTDVSAIAKRLETLEEKLNAKTTVLNELNHYLQKTSKLLTENRQQLEAVTDKIADLHSKKATAEKQLESLQRERHDLQIRLAHLTALLSTTVMDNRPEEIEPTVLPMTNSKELSNLNPLNVRVTGAESSNEKSVLSPKTKEEQAFVSQHEEKMQKVQSLVWKEVQKRQLPTTGDSKTMFSVIIGVLAMMGSFSLRKTKKNHS